MEKENKNFKKVELILGGAKTPPKNLKNI